MMNLVRLKKTWWRTQETVAAFTLSQRVFWKLFQCKVKNISVWISVETSSQPTNRVKVGLQPQCTSVQWVQTVHLYTDVLIIIHRKILDNGASLIDNSPLLLSLKYNTFNTLNQSLHSFTVNNHNLLRLAFTVITWSSLFRTIFTFVIFWCTTKSEGET